MTENLDLIGARTTSKTMLDPCINCVQSPRICGEQLHNLRGGVECKNRQKPIRIVSSQTIIETAAHLC